MIFMDPRLPVRFWTKVAVDPNTECWRWTAVLNHRGYGQFGRGSGDMVQAHRFAYETLVGPIPRGLVIDHLCRVRCCVNPAHLEPVTSRENSRRGNVGNHNASKTHCVNGHPFDASNTGMDRGFRRCIECTRERARCAYTRKTNAQETT